MELATLPVNVQTKEELPVETAHQGKTKFGDKKEYFLTFFTQKLSLLNGSFLVNILNQSFLVCHSEHNICGLQLENKDYFADCFI